jgi:hypothetical protein
MMHDELWIFSPWNNKSPYRCLSEDSTFRAELRSSKRVLWVCNEPFFFTVTTLKPAPLLDFQKRENNSSRVELR